MNKAQFAFRRDIWNNRYLYAFILPGVVWFLVFCYQPLYGLLIAFKDYDIVAGVTNSPWAGFKYFTDFFNDYNFKPIMINTIMISLLKLAIGFPAPIVLALLLNEVRKKMFKRIVQTISYLPFFVSWVVVSGIWYELLTIDQGGIVNTALMSLGLIREPIFWLGNEDYFWWIVVASDIWKGIGWGAIIYLAALSGIDEELYEASVMDGAGRMRQTWHITLPGIRSTIIILFILATGNIMNAGFDQIYVMQNPMVLDRAQIIDTYVMTAGIFQANYSIATAVGLFKSVIGLALLLLTNALVKLLGEEGIL
ncbi:ABC transporter permease [Paenibacillus mendelii]|uniref:ABC transporter permease n=1 Tax=Paenibacillus mendelii TaxID=206163 RepID=A0ABV6JLA8_9BACL|nr:ABC transporter permease subunit [Paenibacillus mendelii]MCQ6562282.1 ABC transporter permease subunit [Paenibacillus mendelii]